MSWNARGIIEGETGEDGAWSDELTVIPAEEDLAEAPAKQLEFARSVIGSAFSNAVLEGKYSVSLSGHDDPNQENGRKSLSMSFSPIP